MLLYLLTHLTPPSESLGFEREASVVQVHLKDSSFKGFMAGFHEDKLLLSVVVASTNKVNENTV